MTKTVKIGNRLVGDGQPCFVIAEIGINHNGDIEIAKKLIDAAVEAGCDAVKFQKRDPELSVPEHQQSIMRETPWGYISYLDYKKHMEFGEAEFTEIDRHCRDKGIMWFASVWNAEAVAFTEKFSTPCYKIASASLTDDRLLDTIRATGKPVILSTGMSNMEEIARAVSRLDPDNLVLMQATSCYPCSLDELNLRAIETLRRAFHVPVGYSGHETGLSTTVTAVALGACAVERHITLDRSMWGTDQAASVEPTGLKILVRDIRAVESALGDGIKRVYESEKAPMLKMRMSAS